MTPPNRWRTGRLRGLTPLNFFWVVRVSSVQPSQLGRRVFDLPDGRCRARSKAAQVINGDCVGVVICWRNLTGQRQAEAWRLKTHWLETENRQIHKASRLKSQFLANMPHELRTPLSAVIGFADLLHPGFVKPDSLKHQQFLGLIGTSGRPLLQLINDVLDLSKVESVKFDSSPRGLTCPLC